MLNQGTNIFQTMLPVVRNILGKSGEDVTGDPVGVAHSTNTFTYVRGNAPRTSPTLPFHHFFFVIVTEIQMTKMQHINTLTGPWRKRTFVITLPFVNDNSAGKYRRTDVQSTKQVIS